MGYGTPMQNQNKGYAAQEKKDLLGDMPIDKVASGGSWMSKHVSSPLAMGKGMQPRMESDSPAQMYGGKKGDDSKSKKDYGSPAKMQGGKKGDDSKSKKDYESPSVKKK
jgi:hypothetical protein